MKNKLDTGTTIIIAATFILFAVALSVKGIGKELLLEAGVLLVSIKLIMMSHKNTSDSQSIREDLHRIQSLLQGQVAVAPETRGSYGEGHRNEP